MIKPNIALAFLLTGLLAACGGDSGDSVVPETGTGTGTGGGTTGGDTDSGGGDAEVAIPPSLQIGAGEGVGFTPGVISFATVSASSTDLDVTVSITDKNNASAPVTGNYRGVFTATCLTPVNGTETIIQNSSSITKRFKNVSGCVTDTIGVTVYAYGATTAIGTATGTINNSTPSVETPQPALGSGSGASFRDGQIATAGYSVVAGSGLAVSISAVDKNKGNALLSGNYAYKFTSDCEAAGTAEFTSKTSLLRSGSGATEYININCTDSDTITAYLFAPGVDTTDNTLALDAATLVIKTAAPKLGFGVGADFVAGVLSGADSLEGSDSLELVANVVNPLSNNAEITADNYEVKWSSSCDTGQFTLPQQNLEQEIRTRYTANCLGPNTLTLVLYERSKPAVVLASATKDVVVSLGVEPKLGYGVGVGVVGAFAENTLNITPATLAAGGTALITANIVDENNAYALVSNKAFGVTIASACAAEGRAAFTEAEKIVFQGEARFSYNALGCVGTDNLTVSLYAVTDGAIDRARLLKTVSGSITVSKAEIGAILSAEISEQRLSVTSIANRLLPLQSRVSFKVADKNGDPVANQEVRFSLTSAAGGISLTESADITDADGTVTALVNSGTTHAITSVMAETTTATGDILKTSSLPISVTTGYPDQNSFSISIDTFNPGAYGVDGETVNVTVRAADYFQNPVPDGTQINFTAESGSITSSCLTADGACSVVWTSQGARPGEMDPLLKRVNEADAFITANSIVGMTTILAYAEGEAGFTDTNANGQFDDGEPFVHMGEAFRDDNWSNRNSWSFTTGASPDLSGSNTVEDYIDRNGDGYSLVEDATVAAATRYQGLLCSETAKGLGHCADNVHVRDQARIVQSAGRIAPIIRFFVADGSAASGYIELTDGYSYSNNVIALVQDVNGNIPANGTTASFSAGGYKIFGDSGAVPNSIGFINERADVPGFPETRGALYSMTLELDDPTKRGPLEADVSYNDIKVSSKLNIRTPPRVTLLYKANNNIDANGDGDTKDLGETFAVFSGQILSAATPSLWAVVQEPEGNPLPATVGFEVSATAGITPTPAVLVAETLFNIIASESAFPTSFGTQVRIYKFDAVVSSATNGILSVAVPYPGGRTTLDVPVSIQ